MVTDGAGAVTSGDSGPLPAEGVQQICRKCPAPLVKRNTVRGLCRRCYNMWYHAGCPPDADVDGAPPLPDDGVDAAWHAARAAAEPEQRVSMARPRAAALTRSVAAGDGAAVDRVLCKLRAWRDWAALVVVLAECAAPDRAPAAGRAGVRAGALVAAVAASDAGRVQVVLYRVTSRQEWAALAVTLARCASPPGVTAAETRAAA